MSTLAPRDRRRAPPSVAPLEGHFPWLQDGYDAAAFFLGDYSTLRRDFGVADYRAVTAGLPIVATVHVEAERSRAESLAETRWLHAIHAQHGFPNAVVANVEFLAPDADAQMAAHAEWPLVRGVRCKPRISRSPTDSVRGQPGTLQDEALVAGLGLLRAHDLLWDVRVPYWHLEEAAEAIARFPGPARGGRARRPAVGPQRRRAGALAPGHGGAGRVARRAS